MNTKSLIDQIVEQTAILIAQLAISEGKRVPLANVSHEMFLELVRNLETKGVSKKVVADMFGLALRSFQKKVRRLEEAGDERNSTLWEAILAELRNRGVVRRADLFNRFRHEEETSVRGLLNDLVEIGLVFKIGRGATSAYRAASDDELRTWMAGNSDEDLDELICFTVYRCGKRTSQQLAQQLRIDEHLVAKRLPQLVLQERLEIDKTSAQPSYDTTLCIFEPDNQAVWGAPLVDHFQAVVQCMSNKLEQIDAGQFDSGTGGSTYSFNVWPDHTYHDEVFALLSETRAKLSALRARVTAARGLLPSPPESEKQRVTFYFGQYLARSSAADLDIELARETAA